MAHRASQDVNSEIGEYVRKAENDFTAGSTTVSKYVEFDPWEDINRIYAYLDSKHISGETDSQGREKPFFNIVLAARNVWYRSTDIDRKNMKVRSTRSKDDIAVFLANVHLQDWMRREDFGTFLNAMGLNMSAFNECVVQFVEQDGRLIPSVVPWNHIICDVVDFDSNPKIKLLELTESQLRKNKSYDQDMVESLCSAVKARELTDRQKKDNRPNYIKLYEVHGEFPLSYLTGNESDQETYVQQMHVVSFVASKDEKGKFDDFTLFAGREAKDPFMLVSLIPEIDGSIAFKGAVKTLFDAQWMQNHSVKTIKDQLDIASLLLFQTSDSNFTGMNVLKALQNGDVLIHQVNQELTQINNKPDVSAITGFQQQWKQLGNEIAGVSETMLGTTPPSGTAWRQVDALLQESHSLFELMTENKGLAIERMFRRFVFPYLKKKMDTSEEVSATFEGSEIERIDAKYIRGYAVRRSNKAVREMILRGMPVSQAQQAELTANYAQEARMGLPEGNTRFYKPSEIGDETWAEVFKDLEWVPEVDVTNENLDKDAAATMQAILTFLVNKQGQPMTPEERFVFNKLLQMTGAVSTIELAAQGANAPMPPMGPPPVPPAQPEVAPAPPVE